MLEWSATYDHIAIIVITLAEFGSSNESGSQVLDVLEYFNSYNNFPVAYYNSVSLIVELEYW